MNKNKVNFWLDVLLVILLVAMLVQLAAGDGEAATGGQAVQGSVLAHCVIGGLLFIGSAVHVVLHKDWVGAVLFRRTGKKSGKLRLNRAIDLGMCVMAAFSGLAGIVAGLMIALGLEALLLPYRAWAGLHRLSGLVLVLFMVVHVVVHLGWMIRMAGRCIGLTRVKHKDQRVGQPALRME